MSKDRECLPCSNCGTELYERFWGNGGWAPTDKNTNESHYHGDCIKVLQAMLAKSAKTDAVMDAWGILANAHGGNWDEASAEWREAAERWRDRYVINKKELEAK